jgi:succinyl-diaminopimelate desuccinylase
MPGAAEAVLDIRLLPEQDAESIVQQLQTALEAAIIGDGRLCGHLELLEVRQPTATSHTEAIVTSLASAYKALTGQQPIYGGVPGSTDGTILHARKGIPIVTCGPGDKQIPHHIDEWVSIEEIKTAARLYAVAAMRYLGTA